jgi:hypothetical protein
VLHRSGGLNLVGPEVLSTELGALPPIEAARLAGEALDRVLAALWRACAPGGSPAADIEALEGHPWLIAHHGL